MYIHILCNAARAAVFYVYTVSIYMYFPAIIHCVCMCYNNCLILGKGKYHQSGSECTTTIIHAYTNTSLIVLPGEGGSV